MITSIDQLDLNRRYTYADYLIWKFQERVELLRGRLFRMSAPNRVHQTISRNIFLAIGSYDNGCELFSAPFDVRLPLPVSRQTDKKIDTVVQPDICVICDREKLDKQGCIGAPDLVVEILSPGNSKKEMVDKFKLYEEAGVREYWIVEPQNRSVLTYHLEEGKFAASNRPLGDEDSFNSYVFPDLALNLSDIFPPEEIE